MRNKRCTLTKRRKFTRNVPKFRFTYIKRTGNFRKQCAPNFILIEFAVIKTTKHTIQREKTAAYQVIVMMLILRKCI